MTATSRKVEEPQSAFARLKPLDGAVRWCRGHGHHVEPGQLPEIRQRDKRLALIGEMTAKFAHEVRTPLASAMLYTAQLDRSTPKQRRTARMITDRLNELGRMINDMLGFAAGHRQVREPVDIHELLIDTRSSIAAQLDAASRIRVVVDDAALQVAGNRDALKGALLNLVTNAIQACDGPAEIVIAAAGNADNVQISVSDDGPGIPADVVPRLFEPFFTTRSRGTGLGLAVVQAVAQNHGGKVSVVTSTSGSCFTMRFPASPPPEERCSG